MRKTMTFVAIMLLAVATNATNLWEETFDRYGTYIEKVEGQYWPYANQWFTGYTGGSGEVTGSRYSFDYTNVTSQGVSIRAKKLNGSSQNTIGLYFPSNKTEDKAFVQFECTLAASTGNRYLIFEICSPESNGGDLSTMVVKVNGNAVTVPATTLGARYTTSTVYIELPNETISSIYFAFNNVPSQKFITHPRIIDNIITYTATSKLFGYNGSLNVGKTTFGPAITSHTFSNGIGTITCSGEITTIGDSAFYWCSGLTSVTIPSSVTTIGEGAFSGCYRLTSVTIPSSVITIEDGAFDECSGLTSVVIPNSVTTIGNYAFDWCSSLTSVTIPNSVTTIGDLAFMLCKGLTSVTIPNSVTTIGDGAFMYCSGLTFINVDAANTHYCSIDGVLFNYAKDTLIQYPIGNTRTTYIIPNSVTTIGYEAFSHCSGLTSVTIGNSVTTIGWGAFYYCDGLTSVILGNSVTTIGDQAFRGCSGLTSVTIPNSVTTIDTYAFWHCSGLTSVTIGNSVTTIGYDAFDGCSGLTSMTCYATTPPTCGSSCFEEIYKTIPIYVPAQSVDAYKQAYEWKDFTNILPISAEEVPITGDQVIVTPSTDNATFTWPANPSADGYSLEITKDGIVFCTLKFNAQGQLTGIAFAPSRDGELRTMQEAEMTASGWQFTVTRLTPGSKYAYTVDVINAQQQSIKQYTGEFTTTGGISTDWNQLTDSPIHQFTKYVKNGRLLIERNGILYDAHGARVK